MDTKPWTRNELRSGPAIGPAAKKSRKLVWARDEAQESTSRAPAGAASGLGDVPSGQEKAPLQPTGVPASAGKPSGLASSSETSSKLDELLARIECERLKLQEAQKKQQLAKQIGCQLDGEAKKKDRKEKLDLAFSQVNESLSSPCCKKRLSFPCLPRLSLLRQNGCRLLPLMMIWARKEIVVIRQI